MAADKLHDLPAIRGGNSAQTRNERRPTRCAAELPARGAYFLCRHRRWKLAVEDSHTAPPSGKRFGGLGLARERYHGGVRSGVGCVDGRVYAVRVDAARSAQPRIGGQFVRIIEKMRLRRYKERPAAAAEAQAH